MSTPSMASVAEYFARRAPQLDQESVDVRPGLTFLGGNGLLDVGVEQRLHDPHGNSGLEEIASLLADVSGECLSSAFSFWGHRVVLDLFARSRLSAEGRAVFAQLRTGEVIGSNAMAMGLKGLDGLEDLPVRGEVRGGEVHLLGTIDWASNLFSDAVIVFPVLLTTGDTVAMWARVTQPGIAVRHVSGLIALNGTRSGSVTFSNAVVPAENILNQHFAAFAEEFRPTYLLLQTAFCAGLAEVSVKCSGVNVEKRDNAGLRQTYSQVAAKVMLVVQRLRRALALADQVGLRDLIQLRLDAALVAGEAARLEVSLAGGAGFMSATAASRRFREASFLPVQSPTEGHLRWQLAQF
ncbi:acyl-CoA/acyl-ACP dehydrogenase [Micrococcales bacterium 31B]|nr:acyl-CoA/acyl-ACP dehydrogenase [Micrococcales bacterium 31B]